MAKLLFIYLSMTFVYINAASTTTPLSSTTDSTTELVTPSTESTMVDSSTISSTSVTRSSTVNTETDSTDMSSVATEMATDSSVPSQERTTSSNHSTTSPPSTTQQEPTNVTGPTTTTMPTTTTRTTTTTGTSTTTGVSTTTGAKTTAGPTTTTTNLLQGQINHLNDELSDLETEKSNLTIAVGVLGAILGLSVLVLIVVYIKKRRKRRKSPFEIHIDYTGVTRGPDVKQGQIFRPSVATLGENQSPGDQVPLETFSREEENKQRLSMLQTIKEGLNSPAQYTVLTEDPLVESKDDSADNTKISNIDGEDTENKTSEKTTENKNGATAPVAGSADVLVDVADVPMPSPQDGGELPLNTQEELENIPPPPPHDLQESINMAPNHTESNGQISGVPKDNEENTAQPQTESQTGSDKSPNTQ